MASHSVNPAPQKAPETPPPHSIDAQAADWVIAQEAEDWPQRQHAFNQWLQTSQAHRQAYALASRNWHLATQLRHMPDWADGADWADALADAPRAITSAPQPSQAPSSWPRISAFVATMLLLLVTGIVWTNGDPYVALIADHRTGVAETRHITLDDGSTVELGADSAIAVDYNGHERHIELLKGRAFFHAAPASTEQAAGRPFVVVAAQGQTRALGTQFMVERLPEKTLVTGIEHRVEVRLSPLDSQESPPETAQAVILAPGETVGYDPRGLGPRQHTNLSQSLAWQRGLLVFNNEPLADVVARLERYQHGRIVLGHSHLADRRISAVVPVGNTQEALHSIAAELGLQVLHLPMVTLLR